MFGFFYSSQAEPIRSLEPRISGLPCTVLSDVIPYHFRSLPGTARKEFFFLAFVKKGVPFPVGKMWLQLGQALR